MCVNYDELDFYHFNKKAVLKRGHYRSYICVQCIAYFQINNVYQIITLGNGVDNIK